MLSKRVMVTVSVSSCCFTVLDMMIVVLCCVVDIVCVYNVWLYKKYAEQYAVA